MSGRSLNQLLAANLLALLKDKGWSNQRLAKEAKISEGTVRNYLAGAEPVRSPSGKERSAKLVEVERLASALRVHPLRLLVDDQAMRERAKSLLALAAEEAARYEPPAEEGAPGGSQEKQHRAAA